MVYPGFWEQIAAEGVGFEPTNVLRRLRFSRPVQSAALPPLQVLKAQRLAGKKGSGQKRLAVPLAVPGAPEPHSAILANSSQFFVGACPAASRLAHGTFFLTKLVAS